MFLLNKYDFFLCILLSIYSFYFKYNFTLSIFGKSNKSISLYILILKSDVLKIESLKSLEILKGIFKINNLTNIYTNNIF